MTLPDTAPQPDDETQAAPAQGEALLAQYAARDDDEDEHQHGCPCCRER